MQSPITQVIEFISKNTNPLVRILREPEVIMWLFDDHSFFPAIEKKNKTHDTEKYKKLEDKWGQEILKKYRPDLRCDKQWTNKFGEHICEEIFILFGKDVRKPKKQNGYLPDAEVDDAIIEAKAQTYYTTGTAGEKILGTPFKYAEIPKLYGKRLIIVCIGGAEAVCRTSYGNLEGPKCTEEKREFLEFFKKKGIEYSAATDLLIKALTL